MRVVEIVPVIVFWSSDLITMVDVMLEIFRVDWCVSVLFYCRDWTGRQDPTPEPGESSYYLYVLIEIDRQLVWIRPGLHLRFGFSERTCVK